LNKVIRQCFASGRRKQGYKKKAPYQELLWFMGKD